MRLFCSSTYQSCRGHIINKHLRYTTTIKFHDPASARKPCSIHKQAPKKKPHCLTASYKIFSIRPSQLKSLSRKLRAAGNGSSCGIWMQLCNYACSAFILSALTAISRTRPKAKRTCLLRTLSIIYVLNRRYCKGET